jgi:ubiquinone/menaquinone biosynthesis C-methylase UbiE
MYAEYRKKLMQYYDEFWKSNFNTLEKEYSKYFLREKQRLISKSLEISDKDILLDLGCGSGLSLIPVASRSKIALGIDISIECLKSLKTKLLSSYFVNSLLETIPLKTSSIDKVVCAAVMEHVVDDKVVLTEVHRILRPEGLVVFNIPNGYSFFYWPKRIIRLFLAAIGIIEPYKEGETDCRNVGKIAHLRRYSKSHFISLLRNNGFTVIKCVGLFIDNGNRFNAIARRLSDNAFLYYLLTSISKIFPSMGLQLIITAKKSYDYGIK